MLGGIWGSRTLKELLLDNNEIGDRGAPAWLLLSFLCQTLELWMSGFSSQVDRGMKLLMKARQTHSLRSLSVSGKQD
jgi:hypothetical protein